MLFQSTQCLQSQSSPPRLAFHDTHQLVLLPGRYLAAIYRSLQVNLNPPCKHRPGDPTATTNGTAHPKRRSPRIRRNPRLSGCPAAATQSQTLPILRVTSHPTTSVSRPGSLLTLRRPGPHGHVPGAGPGGRGQAALREQRQTRCLFDLQ